MNKIKYYYINQSKENVAICSHSHFVPKINDKPIGVEISEHQYTEAMDHIKKGELVYIDKYGHINFRDKFTKYDEQSDSWVKDEEALLAHEEQIKLSKVQILFDEANKHAIGYRWHKLTNDQQDQLLIYMSQLEEIIITKNTDLLNKLSPKPNFI